MKSILLLICTFGTVCGMAQVSHETEIRVLEEKTFSFGKHTSIGGLKRNLDGSYYTIAHVENEQHDRQKYILNISPIGDTINRIKYPFQYFLSDWAETKDAYYVVTTHRKTMGGYTEDYLSKYDKTWKKVWTKKVGIPKFPNGNSLIVHTPDNQLMLISDELLHEKGDISFEQFLTVKLYDINGKELKSKRIKGGERVNPVSIKSTKDGGYLITAESGDHENINLWLIKIDAKGKVIWKNQHENFYASRTIQLLDSSYVFLGGDYEEGDAKKMNYHYIKIIKTDQEGNLIWRTELKRNYYETPGNMLELSNGRILFSAQVMPIKDKGRSAAVFVLNAQGEFIFEHQFDFKLGSGVPQLMPSPVGLTMIAQKWIGEFGDPFHNVIIVKRLSL